MAKDLMCVLGVYGHIYTKYEVSVFNPVPRWAVHMPTLMTTPTTTTMHDGQIMIT